MLHAIESAQVMLWILWSKALKIVMHCMIFDRLKLRIKMKRFIENSHRDWWKCISEIYLIGSSTKKGGGGVSGFSLAHELINHHWVRRWNFLVKKGDFSVRIFALSICGSETARVGEFVLLNSHSPLLTSSWQIFFSGDNISSQYRLYELCCLIFF